MSTTSFVQWTAALKQSVPPMPLLPLERGDFLTRAEFERRYEAMPHAKIMGWLSAYVIATAGVDLQDNATVRLDIDNEVQPDCLLRIEPASGGRSQVSDDGYIEGAPELIVEVAASSASYDLRQ